MAIISNYGTYPEWSPYKKTVIQEAITFHQENRWHDNEYVGPWTFVTQETGHVLSIKEWRAEPYLQDHGSTFSEVGR